MILTLARMAFVIALAAAAIWMVYVGVAADDTAPFQCRHFQSGLRKIGCAHHPVVAGADDDRIRCGHSISLVSLRHGTTASASISTCTRES